MRAFPRFRFAGTKTIVSAPALIVLGGAWLPGTLLPGTLAAQPFGGRPLQTAPAPANAGVEQQKTDAEDAYKRGDYPKTVEITDGVLRQSPNDHVALYLRGSARIESGVQTGNADSLRSGIADAREAIRLGGGDHTIYYLPYLYGMTNLTRAEGRPDHAKVAVQVADQALNTPSLKPDEKAKLTYQRGLAYAAQSLVDEAVRDFEAAIRLDPKLLAAYTAAADALAQANRPAEARKAYDRAIAAFPETPLVYNNRGMFLQQSEQLDDALADFTRAIDLNNSYFYSYTNRGFALMQKGDAQAAEADFTASLRINPNQAMVYGLRGNSRLAAGRLPDALADHRKAAELAPNNPVAYTDLGFSLFFSGRYDDALRTFDRAVQLNPNFRHLDPWRVACLEELGRDGEAKTRFADAVNQTPTNWNWIDQLLAFELDRITGDQLLAAVASEEPAHEAQLCEAEYFVGRRLKRQNKPAEARTAFQRSVETDATYLSAYRGAKLALEPR